MNAVAEQAAGTRTDGPVPRIAVSLVIPMRNETESLPELVRAIKEQIHPPDEIILVDGGSTDGTAALARDLTAGDPRFRDLETGPGSPGRNRNVGIAAASCDWVALTDAGTRQEPDWLEQLAAVAAGDETLGVVYGNYEPITDTWFEDCAALAYPPAKQERPGGRMRGPSTASMLVRRRVWEAAGGFPDQRAAEDLAFFEAVDRLAVKKGWAPRATVHWHLQPTFARTYRKFVLYSRHNVWAGRQRDWHYGIARKYLVAAPLLVLGAMHSPWWFALPVLGHAARTARSVLLRREGRPLSWLLNPARLLGVAAILLVIDAATFAGWLQARLRPPARHA